VGGRTYDATVQENQWITIHRTQETGTRIERYSTRVPSDRVKPFENSVLRIEHPDNWQAYGRETCGTITPTGAGG